MNGLRRVFMHFLGPRPSQDRHVLVYRSSESPNTPNDPVPTGTQRPLASPPYEQDSDDELHYLAPAPMPYDGPTRPVPQIASAASTTHMRTSQVTTSRTTNPTSSLTNPTLSATNPSSRATMDISTSGLALPQVTHQPAPVQPHRPPVTPQPLVTPPLPLSEAILNNSNRDAAILSEFAEYWQGDARMGIVIEQDKFLCTTQLVCIRDSPYFRIRLYGYPRWRQVKKASRPSLHTPFPSRICMATIDWPC